LVLKRGELPGPAARPVHSAKRHRDCAIEKRGETPCSLRSPNPH
jgi:hypothetical protein